MKSSGNMVPTTSELNRHAPPSGASTHKCVLLTAHECLVVILLDPNSTCEVNNNNNNNITIIIIIICVAGRAHSHPV